MYQRGRKRDGRHATEIESPVVDILDALVQGDGLQCPITVESLSSNPLDTLQYNLLQRLAAIGHVFRVDFLHVFAEGYLLDGQGPEGTIVLGCLVGSAYVDLLYRLWRSVVAEEVPLQQVRPVLKRHLTQVAAVVEQAGARVLHAGGEGDLCEVGTT